MSKQNRIKKAAIVSAIAGAAIVAPLMMAGAASAATPSAGSNAVEYSVKMFGPKFVLDAEGGGNGYQHQKVILWAKSNSDKAEDFTVSQQGTVQEFADAGLVSRAFALHYGGFHAQELEYTPDGRGSGLCVGTWEDWTPNSGAKLRLERCGVGPGTMLAVAGGSRANPGLTTVLTGAGNNFSHPLTLAWPSFDSTPQDRPHPWLQFQNLSTYSNGSVPDTMLWKYHQGVVSSR